MGWEKGGRYYTRSRKVGDKVIREYVGSGRVAELAARLDALDRQERETKWAAMRAERDELDALDAPLDELNDLADLVAKAALLAAGFHCHRRCEWRRRRVRPDQAG